MSSGSQEKHAEIRGELAREIRQFTSLGTSFFRTAATQIGLAVTDVQVMDILESTGPTTAGQLAELTGLTTGAITRILDRLAKADLVYRERDPNDGRKVIVRLAKGKNEMHHVRSILDSVGEAWDEVASRYDDEQIAFLLEFLKHSNTLSRQELVRLQQIGPSDEGGIYSAPLENQQRGRLVVSGSSTRLNVHADDNLAELYQARFEGSLPGIKVKEGVVTVHYPRRMLGLSEKQGVANIALSASIPWQIAIQGGAEEVVAELGNLNLAGLRIMGGFNTLRLHLPTPSTIVPIHITGGASEITIMRPPAIAAQVHIKGWASHLVFDDQTLKDVGKNAHLQSPNLNPAIPHYDIEVTSYTNTLTITSG